METLENCPFCGHTAEITIGEHSFEDVKIRCTGCFTEGPLFDYGDERKNVNDAVIHWNTRTR